MASTLSASALSVLVMLFASLRGFTSIIARYKSECNTKAQITPQKSSSVLSSDRPKHRKEKTMASLKARIKAAAAKRQRRYERLAEADAELRELVQEGFAQGYSGPVLAEVANVSVPRIYQIRDGRR